MDKSSFRPVQSQPIAAHQLRTKKQNSVNGNPFSLHLQQAISESKKLTLSKHAKERLEQRNITITEKRWQEIEQKVNEAKKLGVKESLVLLDDAALIISAKNKTVITAMNRKEATTQIFTNIDGTIVLE